MHDLVFVGAVNPLGKYDSPSLLASELLERVRAPILVASAKSKSFDLESPAVIAWNGSAENAHALRAAMPMLSLASSIHILCVSEESDPARLDLPSTQAAEYLAHYDLDCELTELTRAESESIAGILVKAAEVRDAGYAVMGGYGRSRFQEQVLGGVTRDMLSNPSIPILLAH